MTNPILKNLDVGFNKRLLGCVLRVVVCIFILAVVFTLDIFNARAYEDIDIDKIYESQYEMSSADKLEKELPKESKKSLERMGVDSKNIKGVLDLTPGKIFNEFMLILREQSPIPIRSISIAVAIMILCALVESMKLSIDQKPLSGIIGVISTFCICTSITFPIVDTINNAATVIKYSANFMLVYIPVMVGIMVASGQALSAASYHMMMVGVGEAISQIASKFLVPLLNVFLAISVVSSLSIRMNLSGICKNIHTIVKWILSFIMTTFVSLLTIQTVVANSADNTSTRTIKFAINNFVPIVGGALSDAFATVQGCIKLLKSGVGAFGVLAAGIIFIPIILECIVWLLAINISASIGDIFELKQISGLLRATSKVISTILAIVFCCMTILTISTVLVLIIGGGVF